MSALPLLLPGFEEHNSVLVNHAEDYKVDEMKKGKAPVDVAADGIWKLGQTGEEEGEFCDDTGCLGHQRVIYVIEG